MLQFNVQRSNFIESYSTVHNEQGWNVRMHPCQVLYGTVHFSRETAQATESSKIVSSYLSEFLRYRKLSGTHPLLVCGHRKLCFLTLQTKQVFLLSQWKKYALPLNLIWNVHKMYFFLPNQENNSFFSRVKKHMFSSTPPEKIYPLKSLRYRRHTKCTSYRGRAQIFPDSHDL